MNLHQRRQFNLVIWVLFAVLFFVFGGLGIWAHIEGFTSFQNLSPFAGVVVSAFFYGFIAGWGFTGLVGGIWLGCRFIGRQSKAFIVFACIFFIITLQVLWIAGIFLTIPFSIYNAVKSMSDKGMNAAQDNENSDIPRQRLTRGKPILIRAVYFAAAVLLLSVAALIVIGMNAESRFYPSPEEAFARAPDGSRGFGEIIFMDEHENNITVFSINDGNIIVSHFLTEIREGEIWYRKMGIQGFIPIQNTGSAQFLLHGILNTDGFSGRINERNREAFGRRPLYGSYRHDVVRSLSINDIPVEYVFEYQNSRGEREFFWYFSDFPPVAGSSEDIVISFGSR